jgi:hypothetical protein
MKGCLDRETMPSVEVSKFRHCGQGKQVDVDRIVQRAISPCCGSRSLVSEGCSKFLQERSASVVPDDLSIRQPCKCRRPGSHAALPPGKMM